MVYSLSNEGSAYFNLFWLIDILILTPKLSFFISQLFNFPVAKVWHVLHHICYDAEVQAKISFDLLLFYLLVNCILF